MPRGIPKKAKPKSLPKPLSDVSTVSLIIPCYWVNQELIEMTERCLLSLAESGKKVDQLIVVNDGSPRGMRPNDYFMSRVDAEVVDVEANRGYTIAVNRGITAATGSVIIVGNNDLLFTKGWLEAILEPLEQGYDISSLPTIEPDKPFIPGPTIVENDRFGSLFAVKRAVFTKLGNLDEDLGRGYFTDVDFQKRAHDAKFRTGRSYKLAVHHLSKSTFKVIDPDDTMYLQSKAAFEKKWGRIY